FGAAADMNPWVWPLNLGAVVVATPELGVNQKQVLRQAYSGTYTSNSRDIHADACLGAYPSVVFLALLVHVWKAKLLFALEDLEVEGRFVEEARSGLESWASRMSAALDTDELTGLLSQVAIITRGFTRFRSGTATDATYEPLTESAVLA